MIKQMMLEQTQEQLPKNYCIMSQKLAGILMAKGFKLNDTAPNKKYPHMRVFYFPCSDELIQIVNDYIRRK